MRTEELWTRGPTQLRILPQAVAEGIKTHLEKHTHKTTMFSIAHPELGL